MKCIANQKILFSGIAVVVCLVFKGSVESGSKGMAQQTLCGLLSGSPRKERQARSKDAGLREERTEIRDTAGALQTFSGKRKLVKTALRIRHAMTTSALTHSLGRARSRSGQCSVARWKERRRAGKLTR